jgi:hypothetical protein
MRASPKPHICARAGNLARREARWCAQWTVRGWSPFGRPEVARLACPSCGLV